MDTNKIPESNTSLRFCEHCGSPLFDYGNVCTACGKRQSPQNSVPEATDTAASAYGQSQVQDTAQRVSGLKGTALGSRPGNAPAEGIGYGDPNAAYQNGNIPGNAAGSGWEAPQDSFASPDTNTSYDGVMGYMSAPITPPEKPKKKSSWLSVFFCILGYAVLIALIVILFLKYNAQKQDAEIYKQQADSALVQIASYEDQMQGNADSYTQQINDYKRKLENAEARIDEMDEEIEEYLDEIYDLEQWIDDKQLTVDFTESYVVVVFDNGSKIYHKTTCPDFPSLYSRESFWAFNIDAAKNDYYPCSKCID